MSIVTRLSAVVVVVAAMIGGMGCSTIRSIASDAISSDDDTTTKAKPKVRSQKEIAACEKMCAVAGDVDGKEDAVSNCKKECRAK